MAASRSFVFGLRMEVPGMALIAIVNGTIAKATLLLTLATWGQTYPTLNFGLLGQLNDLGFGHAWQL